MALALHAARRPTLLFEFLDYPHQSLNFLFLESFVVQPNSGLVGVLGYREIRAKRIFPFQRLSAILAPHPYIWGAIVRALFRF